MVRNGVLQQSAFDPVDMFCDPVKQVRILSLVKQFYDGALAWLQAGGSLGPVLTLASRQALVRLKSTAANGDTRALDLAERALATDFEALEKAGKGRQP